MKKLEIHLIHGWTYSLDNWADFLTELKKAGFKPVLHNVPGLTTDSDEVWTVERYMEWLGKELEGVEDPIVVCHSNGGRIALAFEQAHPGSFKHMVLIGSAGVQEQSLKHRIKKTVGRTAAKVLKPLIPEGKPRRMLYRLIGARDYGNAKPNMRETMQNMLSYDKHFDFTKIKAPVTMIWGEHDAATPVRHGLQMKEQLKNVMSWTIIKSAGHSPYINHAEDVVAPITKDLESYR